MDYQVVLIFSNIKIFERKLFNLSKHEIKIFRNVFNYSIENNYFKIISSISFFLFRDARVT